MPQNHFVMDTKGYCLFCLKLCPKTEDNGPVHQDRDSDEEIIPNVFSLQRLSHYLRLNRKKIFHDVISVSPTSLPVLEKSELKGVLCEECSQLTKTISNITLELEVLQMRLDSCLFKLHDKINGIEKDAKLKEEIKLEMLNNPQTLIHFGIVEQLQKEIQSKCSLLIGKSQPRVILTKCDIPTPVAPRRPFPLNDEPTTMTSSSAVSEREEKPELCESTPTILSVVGNYRDVVMGHSSSSAPTSVASLFRELGITMETNNKLSHHPGTLQPAPDPPNIPPTPTPAVPQDATRQCKFCLKTFRTPCLKRDHERVIHQGIKFHCGYCSVTFTLRSSMNRHKNQFHKYGRRAFKTEVVVPATSESSHFQSGVLEAILSGLAPDASAILAPPPALAPVPITNALECRICHKTFGSSSARRQHEKVHLGFQYPCDLCGSTFTRRRNMMAHRERVHKDLIRRPFMPEVSNKELTDTDAQASQYQFETELKDVGELPLKIEFQTMGSESEDLLALSTPAVALPIESIGTSLDTNADQNNLETGEPSWVPETSAISTLPSPGTPLPPPPPPVHMRIFECRTCHSAFRNASTLKRHETIHLGLQFPCDLCSSIFNRRSNMLDHRKRAHAELVGSQVVDLTTIASRSMATPATSLPLAQLEPVPSTSTSSKNNVQPPESKSGLEKFPCKICGKPFSQNRLKLRHERTMHQGHRFSCKLCPAVYTLQCNLSRHKRRVHNQGRIPKISALQFTIGHSERIELHNEGADQLPNFIPEDDNPEGGPESDSLKCQHCPKVFPSLPGLRQHQSMAHNYRATERKHECEYCGKRFVRNSILMAHRLSLHLGKRYRCLLCPQEFTQLRSMRNHMKTTCPNRNRP